MKIMPGCTITVESIKLIECLRNTHNDDMDKDSIYTLIKLMSISDDTMQSVAKSIAIEYYNLVISKLDSVLYADVGNIMHPVGRITLHRCDIHKGFEYQLNVSELEYYLYTLIIPFEYVYDEHLWSRVLNDLNNNKSDIITVKKLDLLESEWTGQFDDSIITAKLY